jgi:hypothetical protein
LLDPAKPGGGGGQQIGLNFREPKATYIVLHGRGRVVPAEEADEELMDDDDDDGDSVGSRSPAAPGSPPKISQTGRNARMSQSGRALPKYLSLLNLSRLFLTPLELSHWHTSKMLKCQLKNVTWVIR